MLQNVPGKTAHGCAVDLPAFPEIAEEKLSATVSTDSPSSHHTVGLQRRLHFTAYLMPAIFFAALITAATPAIRGSDQYWYVSEVEQLLDGRYNQSNVVFPYHAVRGMVPPSFNHHTVTHYLVLPFAGLFGAFRGWVLFNTLAALITALAVAGTVKQISSRGPAIAAFIVTLFLPLTIWVTAQPYLETSLAMLVAVGMYWTVRIPDSDKKWWLLLALSAIAYMCRISFLPLLLLVPCVYLYRSRPRGFRAVLQMVLMVLFAAATIIGYDLLFHPDPALNLRGYLASTVPGKTDNFHLLYSLTPLPLDPLNVLLKIKGGIYQQLFMQPDTLQIFYFPFNAMAVVVLCAAIRRTGSVAERRLLWFIAAVLVTHFMTVALRSNQLRFLTIVSPALVAGMVAGWQVLRFPSSHRLLLLGAAGALCLDLAIVSYLHRDGLRDLERQHALKELIASRLSEQDAILAEVPPKVDFKHYMQLGYVLKPRQVLFLKRRYGYTEEELEQMRSAIAARWLLAEEGSPYLQQLGHSGCEQLPLPKVMGQMVLCDLAQKLPDSIQPVMAPGDSEVVLTPTGY